MFGEYGINGLNRVIQNSIISLTIRNAYTLPSVKPKVKYKTKCIVALLIELLFRKCYASFPINAEFNLKFIFM